MARDALLTVDAGTSTIKAVAFDADGAELATARRETETRRPEQGHSEQDMAAVRDRTFDALQELAGRLPAETDPVGVGLTGQGDGLWTVTPGGDPAGNAILWSDSRAAPLLEEWEADGTLDAIVEQCGSAPYPGMSLPLLVWLARNEPGRFDRIGTVLSCKDWLAHELTGAVSIDHSEATVPYLDSSTGRVDRGIFETVGLPEGRDLLPDLMVPTEVVGEVTPEAAGATGLDEGLPVISGPFDVPAAGIGSGTATPGGCSVTLGTSLTHQVLTDGPRAEAAGIGMALGIEGLWTYAVGSNAGTPSLEWAADTVADVADVADLEPLARRAPVGSDGVFYHPYLSTAGERGPFVDPDARAQFLGLGPDHDTEHFVRAVYEGLSLAVRDCVEHLPVDTQSVAASGGGARSELWCQLLADCLDRTVVVPTDSEPGAKGVAVVLGVALGEYDSLAAGVDRTVSTDRRYTPREDAAAYDTLYDLFVDVREEMATVWDRRAATYRELADS